MPDAALTSEDTPPPAAVETETKPSRVWFRLGPVAVTSRLLGRAAALIAVLIVLSLVWGRLDLEELHARAKALPAAAVIAAISVLPLVGFPVSWLHLIAGVRFDFWGGIAVVAVTSVLHHVLGWALVHVLPKSLLRRLDPWREKLRGAGHRDATLLCCLLPGMPYTVQLYLLPLIGTPAHLLFGLSSALHTARAVVTILLGDMSDRLTAGRVAALAGYYALLFTVSGFSLRHLRRALRSARGENPATVPAPPARPATPSPRPRD